MMTEDENHSVQPTGGQAAGETPELQPVTAEPRPDQPPRAVQAARVEAWQEPAPIATPVGRVNGLPPSGPGGETAAPSGGKVSAAATLTALACLAAGWIAAGSVGVMDDTLRRALMWAMLVLAMFAGRVFRRGRVAAGLLLVIGAAAVVVLAFSRLTVLNVLAAALMAALVAASRPAPGRRMLAAVSQALVVLAAWRLVVTSVPLAWHGAQQLGEWMSLGVTAMTQRPLRVGGTFGGVDFLVTMAALVVSYLPAMRRGRLPRALGLIVVIAAGHVGYLMALAFGPELLAALPASVAGGVDWLSAVRVMVPWNMLAIAALVNLLIAAAMIRWSTWSADVVPAGGEPREAGGPVAAPRPYGVAAAAPSTAPGTGDADSAESSPKNCPFRKLGLAGAMLFAATLPIAAVFSPGPCRIADKTFVAIKPKLTRPTTSTAPAGLPTTAPAATPTTSMPATAPTGSTSSPQASSPQVASSWLRHEGRVLVYLGDIVKAFGGRWRLTRQFAKADLADANVVVVLPSDRPWRESELARLDEFVRAGGSLLIACSPASNGDANSAGPTDELLSLAGMRLRAGRVVPAVAGWAGDVETFYHPSLTGGEGISLGGGAGRAADSQSGWLGTNYAAAPMVAERWGWADADGGNGRYDGGERLGDLLIAAERRLGKGTVVVIADPSDPAKRLFVRSGAFADRLMGYLASRPASAGAWWRQMVSLVAAALLVLTLVGRAGSFRPAVAAIILAACLWAATLATAQRCGIGSAGPPPAKTSLQRHAPPGQASAKAVADSTREEVRP